MGYKDIFRENQEKYEISNRIIFKKVLEIFKRETGLNVDHLLPVYQIDSSDPAQVFCFTKWFLFTNKQEYIPYFYKLLESFGYDMFSEVMDTIVLLGKNAEPRVHPDYVNYALISPYINRITVDNNKDGLVTIDSEELGTYSFYPSRFYLQDNEPAINLIKNYVTQGFCHQMSWAMMDHIDKCELVTSLLPSYFEGTHYHTVLRNEEGLIIDVANEAVYSEDVRDMLFKSKDICSTAKEDADSKLKLAIEAEDEESKTTEFPNAMLLTLHEQSKGLKS